MPAAAALIVTNWDDRADSADADFSGRRPEKRNAKGVFLTLGILPFAASRPASLFAPQAE